MRKWWTKTGALWLALLLVIAALRVYIGPLTYYLSKHYHLSYSWWMEDYWFPCAAVAVGLIGAIEASGFADRILKDSTIPDLRLPIKTRAVVCFSQLLWPSILIASILFLLFLARVLHLPSIENWPGSYISVVEYNIWELDVLEYLLIALYCIGYYVVINDKPWMSFLLLCCFWIYSSNSQPLFSAAGRPPWSLLEGLHVWLALLSYLLIVGCIVTLARRMKQIGLLLFWILVSGVILGFPGWMASVPSCMTGSSFLPCGQLNTQTGYLFCWAVDSLDDPLLCSFVNLVWVAVQYLIFFSFVFEDNLISPTRRIRR
jgi:hypothetical protein